MNYLPKSSARAGVLKILIQNFQYQLHRDVGEGVNSVPVLLYFTLDTYRMSQN